MQTLPRIAVAAIVMLAAPAGADESEPAFEYTAAYEFARPDGLSPDHDLSMKLSETLLQEQHFGGLPAMVVADAAVGDQWAFYIFDISSAERAAQPEQVIRDTFQQLRTGSGEVLTWNESVEDDIATVTMEWRFDGTKTFTMVRSHMWTTSAGAPHQLRAECIMPEQRVAEVRPKCEAAFAALKVVAPDRGTLGPLPTASKPAVQTDDTDSEPGNGASLRPPTEGAVVYESKPARTPKKDNTFLYVGGAILLVVAVYLAMRRTKDDEPDEPEESDDE